MDPGLTKRLEHICLKSDLDLLSFGEKFQKALALPTMRHDYENETEWLEIDREGINYNVSKPYEDGTLQEWDDTAPEGCNFGIVLSLYKDHPFILNNLWVDNMIASFCEQIAKIFNTEVYHHRSLTLGIDKSERKSIVFHP